MQNILIYGMERYFDSTQKPLALMERIIMLGTNEGDLVLDNCAGSGTTGIACRKHGRDFIMIESDSEYVKIANKRLKL